MHEHLDNFHAEMSMLHRHTVSEKSKSLRRGLSLEVSWKPRGLVPSHSLSFFLGVDIVTHVYGKDFTPFACYSPEP